MTSKKNVIAMTLQVVGGVAMTLYAIRALILLSDVGGGPAFEVFLQGAILGMVLIGFGEVIKLMQGLFNQREPDRPIEKVRKINLLESDEQTISLEARNRIIEYYTGRNIIVDDIESTPYSGFAIVHHDGRREVVDLNNWEVEVLTDRDLEREPELRNVLS